MLGKTICINYKTKKRRKATEDELMIFKNTQQAIIDEETWNNANRLRKTVRRSPKSGEPPNRLTGLIYCADCGAKMSNSRVSNMKYEADNAYKCSSYRQYTKDCSMHYIRSCVLEELIKEAIQKMIQYVNLNEEEFLNHLENHSSSQKKTQCAEYKAKLKGANERFLELDILVKKLYETFALGNLKENHFNRILSDYDTEQQTLEIEVRTLQVKIAEFENSQLHADEFLKLVKKYSDFEEITTPMLNEFIEQVVVYEAEKFSGERHQRVEIYFNFIGNFVMDWQEYDRKKIEEEAKERQVLKKKLTAEKARVRARERYKTKQEENNLLTEMEVENLTSENKTVPIL